jgi:hypothetical protein
MDACARWQALAMRRSFKELPPTHFVRVTPLGLVADAAFTPDIRRFLHALRKRLGGDLEYFWRNEWQGGPRHMHMLLRTSRDLPTQLVGEVLEEIGDYTHYCQPVRNSFKVANYVCKYLRDVAKRGVLPPQDFQGHQFSSSRRFLVVTSLGILVRQLKQEWRARMCSAAPRTQPGEEGRRGSPHETTQPRTTK